MLDEDQVASYERNGFLAIRGVFHGDELRRLREAAERVVADAAQYGRELDERGVELVLTEDHGFADWGQLDERQYLYARNPAGERVFRRAERLWRHDPIFRLATANPSLLNAVAQVLKKPFVPVHDTLVVKMPGAGAAVPWHRDPSGEDLIRDVGDASSDFTCDVYLDPSTVDNGCLWALPGSHRGEPAEVADVLDFDVPGAVPLEAEPGDVVLHSTGLLHGSPRNTGAETRRTFYVHYRPPEVLGHGFWDRPQSWIDEHVGYLQAFRDERAGSGLTDDEPYVGPLPQPTASA